MKEGSNLNYFILLFNVTMNMGKTNISYRSWKEKDTQAPMLRALMALPCIGDMEDSILQTSVVFKI